MPSNEEAFQVMLWIEDLTPTRYSPPHQFSVADRLWIAIEQCVPREAHCNSGANECCLWVEPKNGLKSLRLSMVPWVNPMPI
jgi:hypothetical protein